MAKTKGNAAAVVEVLTAAKRELGSVFLRDLEGAVDLLWGAVLEGRARKAAMTEVERNTRGQTFRIETGAGPLFAEASLWEFAGRSGSQWSAGPPAPTWPRLRASLRRVA